MRVAPTEARPQCPDCGFKCRRVHDVTACNVCDLDVSGRRRTLLWMRRHMICDDCGSRWLEEHDCFDGKLTLRLAKQVVADARVTADPGGGSPSRRERVGDRRVGAGVVASHRQASPPSTLLGAGLANPVHRSALTDPQIACHRSGQPVPVQHQRHSISFELFTGSSRMRSG